MKSKIAILLLLNLTIFNVRGHGKIEFDDVTKKALAATENALFPDAKAAILIAEQETYLVYTGRGISLVTEIKKRIKFYGQRSEAFSYATQHIYLYDGSRGLEDISKINGTTYNLVQGKIVESKLRNDGIFEKEINEEVTEVSFTLPAVKKGSIIDFEYKISSPYFWDVDEFVLQYDIPLMKGKTRINAPSMFLFHRIFKGSQKIEETHERKGDHRIGQIVNKYTYSVKNVPALKDEKYVDNVDNYRLGVIFELAYVNFPNGEKRQFSISWEDVATTLSESDTYNTEMNRTRFFSDKIDALLTQKKDTLKRLKTIFDYVKTHVKWNGDYGKYVDKGIKDAYKEKTGNVAEVNLILVSMLRYAGITADPVVISTRDNLKPTFPTLDRLDYVIVLAVVNGKQYFMDATETYSKLNLLPIRDYNWRGMLIDGEDWRFVDLTQPPQSELMRMLQVTLNADNSVVGKVRTRRSNHYAYFQRKEMIHSKQEDFIRNKESEMGDISITDYASEYKKTNSGILTETFSYEYKNAIKTVSDKLFFKPLLFLAQDENPFKSKTRDFPINFGYPFKDKTMVNIKIPKGYTVAFLPKSLRINLGKGLGQFEYLISQNGSFISLSTKFEINKASIPAVQYEFLKKFFNQMIEKHGENIVLEKI